MQSASRAQGQAHRKVRWPRRRGARLGAQARLAILARPLELPGRPRARACIHRPRALLIAVRRLACRGLRGRARARRRALHQCACVDWVARDPPCHLARLAITAVFLQGHRTSMPLQSRCAATANYGEFRHEQQAEVALSHGVRGAALVRQEDQVCT